MELHAAGVHSGYLLPGALTCDCDLDILKRPQTVRFTSSTPWHPRGLSSCWSSLQPPTPAPPHRTSARPQQPVTPAARAPGLGSVWILSTLLLGP